MSYTKRTVRTPIGARRSLFAPVASKPAGSHPTYGGIIDMGESVKAYLTKTYATGDVYGDDRNVLHSELFISGQLDCETTCSDLEVNAALYGRKITDGVETSNVDDAPPQGGYGYIEPIMLANKTVIFRATFLYLVSAMPGQEKDEADTRKNDFNPKMNAVSFYVSVDETGDWRDRKEFSTEASALAWLESKFGSSEAFAVRVLSTGAGTVSPEGTTYVTSGGNLEISLTGTLTKLYDNGTDKTSSVSSGKYTISAIAAAHDVVAIFSA